MYNIMQSSKPPRKNYKKKYYKKKYNRKGYQGKSLGKSSTMIVRHPSGAIFADRMFTKVRYTQLATVSGASNAFIQMRLNGAYDPNAGLGGGQPLGWDQLSALYLKYKVHYSKITVKCNNLTSIPTYCVIYPVSSASVPVGLQSDMEQRYSRNRMISGTNGGGIGTITNSIGVRKLYGETQLDDNYEALTASSTPSTQGYWNVSFYTTDGTTNINMPVAITVEYYIEFTDPVRLVIS